MTPTETARALLDIHHGSGASKRELGAHIVAYERVVPALLDALDAQRAAGGCARDQRTTQFCAEAVAKDAEIARLRSEVDRLTIELAAAKAVDWEVTERGFWAQKGGFTFTVSSGGWWLEIEDRERDDIVVTKGPETGEPGKAACFAAYLRACGLSAP